MVNVRICLTTVLLVSLSQGVPLQLPFTSLEVPQVSRNDSSKSNRLPNTVKPYAYDITLVPDMESENFTFEGKLTISINILKDTNTILFHASKNLAINRTIFINCTVSTNTSTPELSYNSDIEDAVQLQFSEKLKEKSNCNLTLSYTGTNNNKTRGFYRAKYTTEDGKQKWMASSHFEPIYAREAFPCWDELAFKAKFTISIKHSSKYKALSNMQEVSTETDQENITKKITHFAPSPKMSPYLVAFAVGEFDTVDSDNPTFQIWIRKGEVAKGKYAMKVGPKILETLENYTQYSYEKHGFRKMDSLAVPKLMAGAMENWGLVIYKEDTLFYTENSSSTSQKEQVASIEAHELAHQWFGNLVTAEWWDDIWLNEGFANYFQYIITNEIEPTWRIMDRFVVNNLQKAAFSSDSQNRSHPMKQERKNSTEIFDAFDTITYSKSGSILRMISHVLGEQNFKNALVKYIKENAGGSVTTATLINCFVENGKEINNLTAILENWITVAGYPVVNVQRDYNNGIATITQSRFFGHINVTSNDTYWIPINYVTEENLNFNDTKASQWFEPNSNSIKIDKLKKDQFIILNKQQFGYYRVNYDNENWRLIGEYLRHNHTNIHLLNRAQLIDDVLNLAKVNLLNYTEAFSVIEYLKEETDFVPWVAAWRNIEELAKFVANSEFDIDFKNYILRLSGKLLKEVQSVKLNETDHITKLKRVDALRLACRFGSQSCRIDATKKLLKWIDDSEENAFSPDDKHWILCAGVRDANQSTWHKLWNKYLTEKNEDIFHALGCTSHIEILDEFINRIIQSNQTEKLSATFQAISSGSNAGINAVLDFLTVHSKHLINLSGYNVNNLKRDFSILGQKLTTEKQRDKLLEFNKEIMEDKNIAGVATDALKHVENKLKESKMRLDQIKLFFRIDKSEPNSSPKLFNLSTVITLLSFLISYIC